MKRRHLLRNLALGAGAALTLPSWTQAWSNENLFPSGRFSTLQSEILAAVAGTFIPEGKTEPGAVSLGVDKFMDRLFADCYSLEDLTKIQKGLAAIDAYSMNLYKQPFKACNQAQRESVLLAFSQPSDKEREWLYNTLRREAIRGYTTSEYVMINHYGYVMAPGFFNGCVDV